MRRKLLLCISTYHLTAAVWARGQLRAVQEFTDDEAGQREFMVFLRTLRRVPLYIVVDTLDEDYRFDTLPRASGRDQAELVQRKLRQTYRNTPYCNAQVVLRDKQNKREDHYFFAALTNPEVLDPWLNLVLARKLPIVGIYMAPLSMGPIVRSVGLADRNTLVVTQHAAGLRQTFFKDGQFRVSRLTLARPDAVGPSAVKYDEEIRNTRGYLDALNITHINEPVTVLILDPDDSLSDLDTALSVRGVGLQVTRLGAEQLARRLNHPPEILRQHRDALPLQLLASAPATINLAPRAVTSGFNRMRASRVLYGAAAAAMALAMIWMSVNLVRSNALEEETQSMALLTRGEEARYNEISRTFPVTPATSAQLRELAETAARVRGAYRPPDLMFQVLGAALDQSPKVLLKSLSWKQSLQGEGAAGSQGSPTVTPTPTAPAAPAAYTQSLLLTAELSEAELDPRIVLAQIDEFIRLLGQHPAVASVRASKYPVSSASSTALTGDTSVTRTEQPVAPAFELELHFKPGA